MIPMPRSFIFEVTQRCNHRCLHCYNAWNNPGRYPEGQLDTPDTLAMLGRLCDEMRPDLATLTGGEPLLRADIHELADYLAGRGINVNLITNGSLLTAERIDRFGDAVGMYELPLLGPGPDLHDHLSGARGAFDRVTMAIAALKAAGRRVVSVFVATRLNLPRWRETAELAFALGVDGIMLNRFNPGGTGARHIDMLQAPPDEMQAALDEAEAMSADWDLPISCSIAMPPCLFDTGRYERLTFGFCAAGTDRAYYTLDPVGNVRPCNHSTTILGNIRERTLREMLDGEAMRDFAAARPAFCAGCAVEAQCQGGCKAAAEVCCGSAWAEDPFLSAFRDRAVKLR